MHAENSYRAAGDSISGAIPGQMFGKPCYKINGKAFICFSQDAMIFKLPEPARSQALSLTDSRLFDPSVTAGQ